MTDNVVKPKEFSRSATLANVKELTEVERKFLDVLMDEAGGDIRKAKKLAGYPQNKPLREITNELKDEIMEVTRSYMAENLPKAVAALVEIISAGKNEPIMGAKDKLAAALALMDRSGLGKVHKTEHEYKGGVVLLPPKDK